MQSTNVRQIKATLRDQAFLCAIQVSFPLGPVVAVSRWKWQLRVMILGRDRWYPVENVRIERIVVECQLILEREDTGERVGARCFR